jgi:flavin reductase (DIM6/NTAB) family NADH-FMN oxidoreductase RutF
MGLPKQLVTLSVNEPVWERFFSVFPLVLVGTREADGGHDLAPKHMAIPIGWENWFGFVCTPRHRTYQNIKRSRSFTVSYPRPEQVVITSFAAAPRCEEADKPALQALPVFPSQRVDGVLVEGCDRYLECELDRIIDGFGVNSLIIGQVVAAHVDGKALRSQDREDNEIIHEEPLFAYLHPGRFAVIDHSQGFPLPAGFKR